MINGKQISGLWESDTPAKRSFVPSTALQGAARNVSLSHGFSQVWNSDAVERLRLWQGLVWLLTGHRYAKRFGDSDARRPRETATKEQPEGRDSRERASQRNDEGSSAFVGADTPSSFSRFCRRNGQTRSASKQVPACHRAEFKREGLSHSSNPRKASAAGIPSAGPG